MAIQPIDLQALFAQLGTVGKTQAGMREAQQMQAALQQADAQKKLEESVRSVNEAQEMSKESGTIKEQEGGKTGQGGTRGSQHNKEDVPPPEEKNSARISNPALGRNLDISG